jgi:hypothetical protein
MYVSPKEKTVTDGKQACEILTQFRSGTDCQTFILVAMLVIQWELDVSMKFSIKQPYELKCMFLPLENIDRWKVILLNTDSTLGVELIVRHSRFSISWL